MLGKKSPYAANKGPLLLLSHYIIMQVIQNFMGFVPDAFSVTRGHAREESTINTLANFNATIAIVLRCFHDDGTEQADEYRQKQYYDTFNIFVPVADNQLARFSKIREEVKCPADLSVHAMIVNRINFF